MVGDYISREAALAFPFANGQYDHENADPHFINGCESYREWLETIPAADVAEVRYGRWKGAGLGDYYCSLCNETYSIGAERVKNWHCCPNCGARMDGGQDDV